jgi:hypothetical protein
MHVKQQKITFTPFETLYSLGWVERTAGLLRQIVFVLALSGLLSVPRPLGPLPSLVCVCSDGIQAWHAGINATTRQSTDT